MPPYGRECGSITGLAAEHIVCVASLSALISLLLLLLLFFFFFFFFFF